MTDTQQTLQELYDSVMKCADRGFIDDDRACDIVAGACELAGVDLLDFLDDVQVN